MDISGLITALSSENIDIRKRAAAALKVIGDDGALPALRSRYANEADDDVKAVFVDAIHALGDKSFARSDELDDDDNITTEPSAPKADTLQPHERLLKQLQSDHNEQVIMAARTLGEMGYKLAAEPLIMLFNNPNKSIHVRHAVAEALLKLESAPVEVALLANLRHNDWQIRRNGAAILGQLQAEWAIQPLSQALRDPHPTVRRTARAALRNIGTPESRKALAQTVSNAELPPMQSRTPGGRVVKRIGEDSKPANSKMLQRLGEEDDDDAAEKISETAPAWTPTAGTEPLKSANLPEDPPDRAAVTSSSATRPLDPDVVADHEKDRSSSGGTDT